MDDYDLNQIENDLYKFETHYDIAEWSMHTIPDLLDEIRKLNKQLEKIETKLKEVLNEF